MPIDLYYRDKAHTEIYIIDAEHVNFKDFEVVIIARPCHGAWIHNALLKALESGCTVYYLGLSRNEENDLGELYDLGYMSRISDSVIGEEGEKAYVIQSKK
jgi:hypothetical protein